MPNSHVLPWRRLLAACIALAATAPVHSAEPAPKPEPAPNVVLIVADDLGFSDLGVFGSEIATPHLDALAHAGAQLTNFHAAPTCSPTRSMLLSGTDNHTAGVGAMTEGPGGALAGNYGYEGRITDRVATLAERLRENGYATVMAGKWHLGMTSDSVPAARGFNQSFALLQGGHNHFGKGGFGAPAEGPLGAVYQDDGKVVGVPEDFYSSDYFTAQLLDKIAKVDAAQPVFAYLAFTAPHSPLQAPAELIAKQRGRYNGGWVELRRERLARMVEKGLIRADQIPPESADAVQAWNRLSPEQRAIEARKMEIYAAMVERLDDNIGRLVEALKRSGRYDNTVFVFTSDNGPAAETATTFQVVPGALEYISSFDNSLANMGSATSFVFYGRYWALAASAPNRLHKGTVLEGGTRVPAFITYPARSTRAVGDAYATVMDVVPTVLELTAIPAIERVAERTVAPLRGRTLASYIQGKSEEIPGADAPIAYELHGQRSVVKGQWKLVYMPAPFGSGQWQLFDIGRDPQEREELSEREPGRRAELIAAWEAYAAETRVLIPKTPPPAVPVE